MSFLFLQSIYQALEFFLILAIVIVVVPWTMFWMGLAVVADYILNLGRLPLI